MEDAHAAKIRAVNRGFADAEVVIDNGGVLERIKTNQVNKNKYSFFMFSRESI